MKKILFFVLISFASYGQGNFFDYTYNKTYIATGTDTYSISQPKITGYYVGLNIYVKFTNSNTTASTLQINSLAPISLLKLGALSLASGDISAGETKLLIYDGTNFQVLNIAGSGGGGSASWGGITGTLSSQTDLQNALNLKQDESIVVNSNTTAVNDAVYTLVASATFTDPTPVEGKGFTVFIRNGTGTVGGTGYSVAGTKITRVFHSGSWANYIGGGFEVPSLAEAQAGTDNTKGMTPLRVASVTEKVYNVKAYGAKGDGQRNNVGGITSGTSLLNSATANFVVGDIGKTVEIPGAGAAGAVLVTTITARNSATQVVVAATASTTVVNKVIWWGTDDTAAIQAAINACFAAKATTVYLPSGIYIIAGALVTSDVNGLNPNSQLYIPAGATNISNQDYDFAAIKLIGENFTPIFNSSSLSNTTSRGTVLKSTINQGTGTRPSIIGGIGFTTGNAIAKMNYTTMFLENINVVASSNGAATCPNMIAVNALDQAQLIFRNGTVTMDCYLYASTMPDPSTTATNSAAIITGRANNNGGNIIENVWVQGAWHRGFVVGEHTYFKYSWTMGVHTAYTFLDGNFEVVGDIGSNSVVNYLEFPNSSLYGEAVGTAFVNLNFAYEASGVGGSPPAWLFPTNVLVDVGQNGRGRIAYFSANGLDNGDFIGSANQYGLHVTPVQRLLTKRFSTSGGATTGGYGSTVVFGSIASTFDLSNTVQATAATGEFSHFIQSAKNNIPDGFISQRSVRNTTGTTGLNGDANENRVFTEIITNDGASLNGKKYEDIFTGSLKRISEKTGDQQQWFTNGTERFRIASAGQFGLGGANYGTSGQVLTSQGSGSAPIWSTISGGGITNTAANNELMMSNGTNAVPSGVFADATGNLNLGTSLSGATRTISATGSATDIGLALQSKGSSAISFTGGGSSYQFGTGGFNFATSGLAITGINTIQSGSTTTLNLLTPSQSGATNGTNVVIYTGDVVTGTAGDVNIYTGSNSGGTEGSVNVQTRATGKLGFFNATAVVKQSAVSTSQGIADVLTAYGLLPSSTISSGGTYYAPSTLVANATDANFTATVNGVHNILDGVASTNRVITIPTGSNGDVMKFYNTEDTRVWSFTGATVYLADRVTVVTELLYNVPCHMEKIDGLWIITN